MALAGALVGVLLATTGGKPSGEAGGQLVSGPIGPEGIPLEIGPMLASASGAAQGQTVDGIQCDSGEQVAYHVHTHLSVYVDGVLRPLPAGIGIVAPVATETTRGSFDEASQCYYWLHVHAQDGVIHIESPTVRSYTLGQFFDVWHQPLTTHRVAGSSGTLTIFVNGRRHRGNPRDIELGSHEDIQIDVGRPVIGPKSIDWSATGL